MNKRYLDLLKQVSSEHENKQAVDINDKVLIIDGLNLYIRVFSAVPSVNDDGIHIGGVTGFLRSLALMIRTFRPTRCVLVFDGKGGSSERKKLYSEYKGNRGAPTKFNRYDEFEDYEAEQRSMKLQFQRLIEYLRCLPITILAIDNIEADDTIAYMVTDIFGTAKDIIVASTDRDYIQLVNERVSVWSPIKKKLYTVDTVLEEYGVHPTNFLMYRVITGDSSDNIPKVPGIGLKTLLKEFNELSSDTRITIPDIIRKCDSITKKKQVHINLLDNVPLMELNEKLMQLHEVKIPQHSKLFIIDTCHEKPNKLQAIEFKKMFLLDKMYTTIKNPETWLRDSFGQLDHFGK